MNLFDVTHGIALPGQNKPKPRPANENEIKAYLIWLADRRGIWLPHDAEYGVQGVYSKSADGFVLEMPGYDQDQRVTMETLDESGEVVASQTLPVEPKKGGVIWDKAAVRKAQGPVAKPAKGKRAKVAAPIPVAAPAVEPVEAQEALAPTCDKPEPAIAPVTAPAVDLDAITARLDALEQALATLSAGQGDTVEAEPVAERPKRTPAHERAIRRAWAERKARRYAQSVAEQAERHARGADARADAKQKEMDSRIRHLQTQLQDKHTNMEKWAAEARKGRKGRERRLATVRRARRMIGAARSQERIAQARASAARAEIDRLKRDMADPSQPERASDIARLVQERDTARTALAAMAARAERAEQGLHSMADRFEGLVSRVTRAEAALRASQAVA